MQNHDKVAIVASGRMYKIDDWAGVMGRHFARVMEAYVACLHAHRPASIVFAEDIKPDTLKQYEAVLVVGQTVEMEPALGRGVEGRQASRRGGFRRRDLPGRAGQGFRPAGLVVRPVGKGPQPCRRRPCLLANGRLRQGRRGRDWPRPWPPCDRPARGREPRGLPHRAAGRGGPLPVRGQQHHPRRSGAGPPVAGDVGLRQPRAASRAAEARRARRAGRSTTSSPASRSSRPAACCKPTAATCPPASSPFFRPPLPACRPAGPSASQRGEALRWEVQVQDSAGKAIAAAVPVRVRLLAADGGVLDQQYAVGGVPRRRRRVHPAAQRCPASQVTLEAVELLSGKTATLARCPGPARDLTAAAAIWLMPGRRDAIRRTVSRPLKRPAATGIAPSPTLPSATSRRPTSRSARTSATWSSPTAASWRC